MKSERIGFIGLGNMGHPMAKNLEKAGFPLFIYNRTASKTLDFDEETTVCQSIESLVGQTDIIISMLTNDSAVKAVYDVVLKENIANKLFVDMSTISPETSLYLSREIKEKQADMIDAPVAGSTKPAADGTLIIMAGGNDTAIERAMPYLSKMGKLVKHLGANGKGLAAKLAINYFLSMIYQGLAETILFSDKLGIKRKDMLEIINQSASGSGATQIKTPALIEENFSPAFALDLMLKDVRLAKEAGATFPLSESLLTTYQAAHDHGFGNQDVISIINYIKSL